MYNSKIRTVAILAQDIIYFLLFNTTCYDKRKRKSKKDIYIL